MLSRSQATSIQQLEEVTGMFWETDSTPKQIPTSHRCVVITISIFVSKPIHCVQVYKNLKTTEKNAKRLRSTCHQTFETHVLLNYLMDFYQNEQIVERQVEILPSELRATKGLLVMKCFV